MEVKQLFNASVLNKVGRRLMARSETLAVAESVTSGLLQFAFSSVENGQHFFQGGVTAYNVAQKFKHLNVEPIHALQCNCVSQKIADEMARQVAIQFNSHWGIGITGYATPVPASDNKVFAFYSIAFRDQILASGKLDGSPAAPPEPQLKYVNLVLEAFQEVLL